MKVDLYDIVGGGLLFIAGVPLILFLAAQFNDSEDFWQPPKQVRQAALFELSFGLVIIFLSIGIYAIGGLDSAEPWMFLCSAVGGVLWIWLAARIRKGSRPARNICIALSLIRLITIIGIPFSLASLHLLRSSSSSEFFELGEQKRSDAS